MTGPDEAISVLVVTGEGGSISLVRQPFPCGLFALLKQEMDYGVDDAEQLETASLQWGDWEHALDALEAYPWTALTPLLMSAQYADRVQAAFRKRSASERSSECWEHLFAQATRLLAIEWHFHELMRLRAGELIEEHEVILPALAAPAIATNEAAWFPVPGMYGGFSYRWVEQSSDPLLVVESWCRVVWGSGQRHHITADGCTLIEEGFV